MYYIKPTFSCQFLGGISWGLKPWAACMTKPTAAPPSIWSAPGLRISAWSWANSSPLIPFRNQSAAEASRLYRRRLKHAATINCLSIAKWYDNVIFSCDYPDPMGSGWLKIKPGCIRGSPGAGGAFPGCRRTKAPRRPWWPGWGRPRRCAPPSALWCGGRGPGPGPGRGWR